MFSALLKKLRSEKNLTQGQLAKEVGVSPGNVGDWETGKSKPGYNALASLARIFEVSADYLLEIEPSPAKASDDLFAHQKTAGLICDGSPLEGEEADLIAMYRLLPEEQREDIFDLVHLKYRKHVERKKESIYWTYHNGSSATKSPPRTLKPKVEPLDFLRCFDLVVNLFSVPLMKRRKTRVESPKTLENRAMGHSPIGFADLSHCSPPVLPRFAAPPRTPRTASARPNPHRSAPKSPVFPKTRTL